MTMFPLMQIIKNRGIKLRGSRRTTRLMKKRMKHLDELYAIYWEEFRQRFYDKHGKWLEPLKNKVHPKTKTDWIAWSEKNKSLGARKKSANDEK